MLTVDMIAEKLNVSRNSIVTLIKSGQLKAIKIGRQYRISEDSFNQLMKASEYKI